MGIDLTDDYNKAKSKISSYQTVVENKKNDLRQKKEKAKTSLDKKKSDAIKQAKELDKKAANFKNSVKSEIKNQLEQLLDLFKQTLPPSGGKSLSTISRFFLEAADRTKEQIKGLLVEEIISTIGCSEEQSYEDKLNQPFYIKVNQVDLFKKLIFSPDDEDSKYYYENQPFSVGTIPSSLNRQLYERLQNLGQSLQTQFGIGYQGASGQDLFDIEYVQFYPAVNPTNFGDFFKVTLKPQLNNATNVADFLNDYYGSIDVIDFDVLSADIMNALTGVFDFSLKISTDQLREEKKFDLILKRIMGVCSDPNKKIDVGGTAKLSDQDLIDDAFFEVSPQELRTIENQINNIKEGVVEFEDCGNVKLPVNVLGTRSSLDEVITENTSTKKIDRVEQALEEMAKDPNWKNLVPGIGINLNLKASIDTDLINQLPKISFKSILSPKVMLGFMIMIKAINSQFSAQIDNLFDDLEKFMKTFKKFTVGLMRKVFAIYVKELFDIVKKNVKKLVEQILGDIAKEAKNKKLQMYSSIVYALLVLGQTFVDYRNCKSVIDDILKLLNLALNRQDSGLPLFALAGSQLLGGVSDTRAFANAVEGIQSAGLPTGDAPDGGPNMMNMAFMAMIKGQNKEQVENGKTEIYIPPLTVVVPPFGAGPGITKPTKGFGKSY
jgi:hypothetical protein